MNSETLKKKASIVILFDAIPIVIQTGKYFDSEEKFCDYILQSVEDTILKAIELGKLKSLIRIENLTP